VVKDSIVIKTIKKMKNAVEAAKKLRNLAYEKGSTDNISVIVIYFS
jgi:serine/threonine protein phosphatase PrpC